MRHGIDSSGRDKPDDDDVAPSTKSSMLMGCCCEAMAGSAAEAAARSAAAVVGCFASFSASFALMLAAVSFTRTLLS